MYYLLGASKEQLAVWHGVETCDTMCGSTGERVYLYPAEYLTYGAGRTVSVITRSDTSRTYAIADHLGSARVTLDRNGTVLGATDYAPFGEEQNTSGQTPRLTFIDKERDGENGLEDFGVRKYDVVAGRFLQVDPHFEAYTGYSGYSYSLLSPLRVTDRGGLDVYITGAGDFLGRSGDGSDVRVISSEDWNGWQVRSKNWGEDRDQGLNAALQQSSTLLEHYLSGISIADETWDRIEENGGQRLQPWVRNESGETIYFKPEDSFQYYRSDNAYPIGPGQDLYFPVDGVQTGAVAAGKVYKVPTTFRVTVDSDGHPNIVDYPDWIPYKYGEVPMPDPSWMRLRDAIRK